jgi:hypothetical protein
VVLFGEREVPAVPVEVPPGAKPTPRRVLEFRFTAPPLPPDVDRAEHVVRLSVDGVHSSPLDRRARPPRFGADQKVTVTT